MEYQIIRSSRRTVALEVKADGTLLVRANFYTPLSDIERMVAENAAWIEKAEKRLKEKAAAHPEPTEEEIKALKKRAREVLPGKVAYYAPIVGVKPTAVRITSAKTRFGSCSGKNSISFSWRLMAYPEAAVDYVVVHELCHIKQHNHSKKFYAEIAKVLPDYKERIKSLKK